ncbi:MAG: restriction endonuclease subunit S [Parolsenella sp.]|uniref:restriction endonuclease subunit S n=1 Tax=Parolsenella sp. TaxID=2083006 RepID=UPI002A7661A9|nr:restriction endonuclease subunit S [Parolsenella sp.]MDY3291606.1 restriction endonuclease subunit S [Parolsenella sp.]
MTVYKFADIAFNSTEKKKPEPSDKDVYIGLEHLDPGILEVTRYGAAVAPKGDKLVMRKGDVLFGRRRAYQKKVAIAPFDGIFSAHGMVLRPRTEVVDPGFFPFFISSDCFLDEAIRVSVGSLSPTANWKDLKELSFDLPSLDEQREIAGIMRTAERAKAGYRALIKASDSRVSTGRRKCVRPSWRNRGRSSTENRCMVPRFVQLLISPSVLTSVQRMDRPWSA